MSRETGNEGTEIAAEAVATTEIAADPEVRQREYQEAEVAKVDDENSRIDAAMAALGGETETVQEEPVAAEPTAKETQPEPEESKTALYARLAEQDYELQQLKKREKKQAKGESLEDLKRKATENPEEVLKSLGIGIDSVLDLWAGQPAGSDQPTEEAGFENQDNPEIVALKEKIAAIEGQNQQKEFESYQNAEKKKVHDFVTSNSGKWPLVEKLADNGSYKDVLDTALTQYQLNIENGAETNEEAVPKYDIVLDMVEDFYAKNIEQSLKIAANIDKFKHYFSNTNEQTPPTTEKKAKPVVAAQRSATTVSAAWNDTASPHDPTDEERFKNAIAAVEATLAAKEKDNR